MTVMFFSKCLKFYVAFKIAIKFRQKVSGFLENCIRNFEIGDDALVKNYKKSTKFDPFYLSKKIQVADI